MDAMTHLPYGHTRNRSLVEIIGHGLRQVLPVPLRSPKLGAGPASLRSRVLVCIGWLIVLVVQAALILLIAELVEVCHGVMELYLDLAQQQLDLTSLYVNATTPE